MIVYFFIIILPVILAYLADNTRGSLSLGLAIVAAAVPCFFAGVRDVGVGTDVMTYGVWTYRAASTHGLSEFLEAYSSISAFGFNFFSWLIAQLHSFEVYLGAIQALTVCPIYLFVKKQYPHSSWAGMLVYMLLLYPISLNIMKQMIAVAIAVPSIWFVRNKRLSLFLLYVVLDALLFHQTALIAIVYYPLFSLLEANEKDQFFSRNHRAVVVCLLGSLLLLFFVFGAKVVQALSWLKASYSYQSEASGSGVILSALAMTLVLILVFSTSKASFTNSGLRERAYGVASIVGSLMYQLNTIAASLLRLSYYAISFLPLYAAALAEADAPPRGKVPLAILMVFLVFYFIQVYVINGGNAVYPYTSTFLGVL